MSGANDRFLDVDVRVDGRSLDEALLRSLSRALVRQVAPYPTTCELVFSNLEADEHRALTPWSAAAEISLIIDGRSLFSGRLCATHSEYTTDSLPHVHLTAIDHLQDLRVAGTPCSTEGASLAELLRDRAAHARLEVEAHADSQRIPHTLQLDLSDLDFIESLGSRAGLSWFLDDRKLHLFDAEGFGAPIPLSLGRELYRVRRKREFEGRSRSVKATTWVPGEAELVHADAPGSALDSGPEGAVWLLPDGESEPSLRDRAAAHAKTWDRLSESVEAEVEGRVDLHPGRRVALEGVLPRGPESFTVSMAEHRIDPTQGYITRIETRPTRPLTKPAGPFLRRGKVSDVADPQNRGRIRVELHATPTVTSGWLPLVSLVAGPGKGLVAVPDVGDHVLVLFTDLATSAGFVLGSIHDDQGPPQDTTPRGSRSDRAVWLTPSGHRICLDDDEQSLHIETASGASLKFDPKTTSLVTEHELLLQGDHVRIKARRVDFDEA